MQQVFGEGLDSIRWGFECRVWHLRVAVRDSLMLHELSPIIADKGRVLAKWARAMFNSEMVDGRLEIWLDVSTHHHTEVAGAADAMWRKVDPACL